MPSVVQKRSYGSVKVFWLDREQALKNLEKCARHLLSERPEVEEIRLFGSLAEGRAVPGSDADLLLIVKDDPNPPFRRAEKYMDYFLEAGLPVELFCYTRDELEKISFAASIYRKSLKLGDRHGNPDPI